jgi:hypothetical protein
MSDFDRALKDAASAILKRELTDEERMEFRDLSDTLGMGSVEDYLYMLMIFKRNEDRISEKLGSFGEEIGKRFGEMAALSEKIDETLDSSIRKILGEGAREIGRDMGEHVAEGAKEILRESGDYHFLRGQVWVVFCLSLLAAISYWLGSANVLKAAGNSNPMDILMGLPSGWLAFICGSVYAYMWSWDHWKLVKGSAYYKLISALQVFLTLCLLVFLLSWG